MVAHLRSRAAEFAFYVGDDGEWAEYLSKMSVTRTWGDELTLRAANEAYGCAVHVVTTEPENWLLRARAARSNRAPLLGRCVAQARRRGPLHRGGRLWELC